MSNFNTLTETSDTQEVDYFLLRQNGVDYKQKRSSMTANKAQSEAGQSTTEFETPAGVNSAMEQFGQFGRNKYITSGSAKDIVKRGGYILSVGVTDKPSSNQEYYLWVDNYNTGSTEVTQKAKATKGSDKTYYTKSKIDGVWESNWTKAWDDINLPRATDPQSLDSNSNVSYVYTPAQIHSIVDSKRSTDQNALDGLTSGLLSAEQLKLAMDQFGQFGAPIKLPSGYDIGLLPQGVYVGFNLGNAPTGGGLIVISYGQISERRFQLAYSFDQVESYNINGYNRVIQPSDVNKPWIRHWNERTLPVVSQSQAEDTANTTPFAWTPQRVAQAIDSRSVGEAQVFEAVYPVGSVYTNYSNPANPNTYLKGGGNSSWTKIEGRVVVGVGSVDGTTFNAGSTGGEVNHQLTIAEMPSHNHNILMAQGSDSSFVWGRVGNGAPGKKYRTETTAIQNEGGDGSHNNMQPYITCYVWRRTA